MKRIVHISSITLSLLMALLITYSGCGGGGGDSSPQNVVPVEATRMDAALKTNMVGAVSWITNIESSLVFMLNPATAPGITVVPDASPGTPPNTVTFSGPYDSNGDGVNETTVSGRATFSTDPAIGWSGVSGQAAVDISIPVLGYIYHGDIEFTVLTGEQRVSGSGTFTDPITGNKTTMTIPASSPLVIKDADGAAGTVANACGNSVSGRMRLDVTGSDGTLTSYWNFNPSSASVAVNGASFTDNASKTTALPDSSVELLCGGGGNISDWIGSFNQVWACFPYESGQATITIAVSGADTITITDEDPPGSGMSKTYQASTIGANTHAAKGFFIGGVVGDQYREDFTWTLRKNNSGFSQFSHYEYTSGPNTGLGGLCVARCLK